MLLSTNSQFKERKTDLARRNKAGSSCSEPPPRGAELRAPSLRPRTRIQASAGDSDLNSTYIAHRPTRIYRKYVTPTMAALWGNSAGSQLRHGPGSHTFSPGIAYRTSHSHPYNGHQAFRRSQAEIRQATLLPSPFSPGTRDWHSGAAGEAPNVNLAQAKYP